MKALPLGLVALGLAAAIAGLVAAPARTWPNLLVDGFYFLCVGVGAMFFLATQRVTSARWSAGLRRVPEAFMLIVPAAALLMAVLLLGRETLYPWSRAGGLTGELASGGKATYLHAPFVFARMAIVLAVWILFARHFRRVSLAQDARPARSLLQHRRLDRTAALFVVAFAFGITLTGYDWIGSLDPSWSSTMFGVYIFAGTFVLGIAAVTLAVALHAGKGLLGRQIGEPQLHDLGKMLFAFSVFWAYIWTCQYLLIWYGDIPEEVSHYLKRTNGSWVYVFGANLVINWIVPFLALLSARAKQKPRQLAIVAGIVLFGRWLDIYLLVIPAFSPTPRIGPLEILIAAGYGGLLYLLFRRNLARAPLVPLHDPVLAAEQPHGARSAA